MTLEEMIIRLKEKTGKTVDEIKKALEDNDKDYDKALKALGGEKKPKDSKDDLNELKDIIGSIKSKIETLEGLGKKTEYIEKLKKIFSEDGGLSQLERLDSLEREIEVLKSKTREMDEFFNTRLAAAMIELTDEEKALVPKGSAKEKTEWVERFVAMKKKAAGDKDGKGDKDINFGTEKPVPEQYKKLKYEDLLKDSALMKDIMSKYPKFYNTLREKYFKSRIN
ncbi:MAG: hypothetical protein AMQ22_00200 [Candidatus Methanofastidiosum methylothiophilum]|uniref:Uncharacterized protein n=1 Tax=Candidatus Methanofastidiosum methylothiophilum TaxID=1705564 RepID=A0A150J8I6_9EURY|nr:MAG: hypothetical protein APG11_00841 [Candidatus Methanofastidiosum methylthiophilus]KYC53529.1 MAG: hypothetical protein AMQ22_00200 [Candidatus Methanofastidiosum methylthiophilus]